MPSLPTTTTHSGGEPWDLSQLSDERLSATLDAFSQIYRLNGVVVKSDFARLARFVYAYASAQVGLAVATGVSTNDEDGGDVEADAMDEVDEAELEQVMRDRDSMTDMIEAMKSDKKAVSKAIERVPDEVRMALTSVEFEEDCNLRFDDLDVDSSGVLEPDELAPLVVEMSQGHPWAVTLDHCISLSNIFDANDDGVISRDEFTEFCRFIYLLFSLKTQVDEAPTRAQEPAAPPPPAEPPADMAGNRRGSRRQSSMGLPSGADDGGRARKSSMMVRMRDNRDVVQRLVPHLGTEMGQFLASADFVDLCDRRFLMLDVDGSGVLEPEELAPVLLDMLKFDKNGFRTEALAKDAAGAGSAERKPRITAEDCKRFAELWDRDGKGTISADDFVEFCRFVLVMSSFEEEMSMEEAEAEIKVDVGTQLWNDDTKVESLIERVIEDRSLVNELRDELPVALQETLASTEFVTMCMEKFDKLDADGG